MAHVSLEQVTKFYPGNPRPAVNAVDLDIRDREFIVLVGPSGCGKSTTLRMVAGLEEISAGTIRIDQRVVNQVPPKDRDIAMVFQNYALYPHMTVYKNMSFALRLQRHKLGLTTMQIHERVLEAAKMLEITDYLDRKPKALSGGQRQRVAVGRAIVRNPKAFLFDEPLSNLDAKLRVETRAQLKKLHLRLQTTTIYVTHDQEEAMTLGDRVVVMNDGIIQQCAPPLDVYDRPVNRFVAGFLGTPPMNFLNGTVSEGAGGSVCFTVGRQRLRLPDATSNRNVSLAELARRYLGRPLVLGVRPEGLAPHRDGKYNWPDNALTAKLNVVEPLGDKVDLTLSAEGGEGHERIVCRADAHEFGNLPRGTDTTLYLDLGRIHLFEPGDNGINIALPRP